MSRRFNKLGEAIALAVDENCRPSRKVHKWAQACGINYNGTFFGDDGLSNQAQLVCHRFTADGRPLKRTEIPLGEEDGKVPWELEKCQRNCLADLGTFREFVPPPGTHVKHVIIHGNHLAELRRMHRLMVRCWEEEGLRWDRAHYLGGATAVGEDMPISELIEICTHPRKHRIALQNNYDPKGVRWHAPNSETFAEVWRHLKMPDKMREIKLELISAQDRIGANNERILAATGDALRDWIASNGSVRGDSYCVVTCAPISKRQGVMTWKLLDEINPGCVTHMLGARLPVPHSPTLENREESSFAFELGKLNEAQIQRLLRA